MLKIIRAILISTVILTTLLIVNIFQTQDIIRIQTIEKTDKSFNFFIKESRGISLNSELTFLKQLSRDKKVTIFKTDEINTNTIMKSVIYDANSFPYQAFGLKKTNLFPNENTVYSNKPSQDHNANVTISTFLSPKTLKLQTLAKTYQDESMSIVGAYTVVLSRNNQAAVLAQLARFFGESTESLQKQTSQSRVGFVNYHLIILAVMILCLLLIMFAINFILPLHHIKTIGIKKLNGWSNSGIFWPEILENIGWIFGISFVVDIGLIIVFDFLPNLLMPTLICVQLVIVLIYLASHLMTYLVIKNMTIHHLLKNFADFKIGVFITYTLKCLIMMATVGVLMLVGANTKSLMTNYQMIKNWQAHQKTLTLDYLTTTGLAGQDLVNNTSENQKRFVDLFAQLEQSVAAQYINVEHVIPTKNYFLSQHHYAHLYHKSDEYNIVHINQNYLEAVQLPFPKAKLQGNIRTFFVPEKYKAEQQKMTHLIQNSIFEGQSFGDQQHLDVNTVPFNIVYYKANIKVFPYNSNMPSQIKQPIFAVFNQQNMSWSEKELLANTGLNHSPIKITNTHNNLQTIQKVIHQQTGDSRIMPKFSSIGSLVGDQIDSNISSLQILGLILLALLLLHGFSSFFLTTTIVQTKRKILAVQKMHGYKVKDRYRWEIMIFVGIYVIQFITLATFSQSLLVLPIVILILLIDAAMVLTFIRRLENKSLSATLRGE
ncbi:DUF1430 domain-containing protein [Leuconostoc lactis]|uniref:DUF1430 domain-containing protein n=1 Tax=Leuconostoc lactis TaxID=1246 RepID=UPI0010211ABD|nr:DUF1430 domain-containing protein [Leuconostoc lactis]MSB66764.1 DUF1430 domain-containing protein [Leuconostoc lactis]RYS87959.1 DUF1430 domain-containing protein [Leuconostoc lactis]